MKVDTSAWNKKKTKMLELPSGAIVEVIDNQFLSLMILNILPLDLLMKVVEGKGGVDAEMDPETKKEMGSALIKISNLISQVVVNPKIIMRGPAVAEGEVSFLDIPEADISYLMRHIMRNKEAADLASFRKGPGSPADGQNSAEVRETAVGAGGN